MAAIQDIAVKRIDGSETTLAEYAGQVLLVVNVASKCGLTPQYTALESLYTAHRDQGFQVLGFPCNQFLGQEPGTEAEIASFCETNYNVDFPLFSKVEVNGPGRHPLYAALTDAIPEARAKPDGTLRTRLAGRGIVPGPGEILWNFEKFLISRDGAVVARFAPDITPDDPVVVEAVKAQLAA
jgi:glutathione peroxidase